jgi:glycosyltransferase involved in cell wall biosynthesis
LPTPIRLLFFSNSRVRAGLEEVVLSLVRGLDRSRFDIHLCAPDVLLESMANDLAGVPVARLPLCIRSWKQRSEIARFVRYLRHHRIDIVNSHLFYATMFAVPLAVWAEVPSRVETTHGPELWRTSWWTRSAWLDRLVETAVTLNIAVSEANRRYLSTVKRYPAHKLRVVYNGRDLSRYTAWPQAELDDLRRFHGLSESARIVACIARLEEQKGHCYLLKALPPVIRAFPDLRLLLLGDGSLRPALEAQTRELGLASNVIFAGFSKSVAAYYHLAEFIVLPSLYEGLPLAAIEAGASSRALLGTAVDGTTEVIQHGRTGILTPAASPPALSEAMMDLLRDPEMARRLGAAARQQAERRFSIDAQLAETSRLYELSLSIARRQSIS